MLKSASSLANFMGVAPPIDQPPLLSSCAECNIAQAAFHSSYLQHYPQHLTF